MLPLKLPLAAGTCGYHVKEKFDEKYFSYKVLFMLAVLRLSKSNLNGLCTEFEPSNFTHDSREIQVTKPLFFVFRQSCLS